MRYDTWWQFLSPWHGWLHISILAIGVTVGKLARHGMVIASDLLRLLRGFSFLKI